MPSNTASCGTSGARLLCAIFLLGAFSFRAAAQTPKWKVPADAPPPPVTYHGLIPGLSTMSDIKQKLGEPASADAWYSYKMLYPSQGRSGLPRVIDAVHTHGSAPESVLGDIEAASIPEGCESESAIRAKLGEPEYELRMASWKLLDYNEKGVRFSLTPEGRTIGVAYFPHGRVRVHSGERHLMDLSKLRQGPQPKPAQPAALEGLKCGVSEVTISPQEPSWLNRPFTIHDDLKARTAVFSDGKLTVALVGADLFGAQFGDLKVIRDKAAAKGITNVVIGMAHNHAAPDTIGVYGFYPEKYVTFIQEQILKGIEQAHAGMKPVKELRTASRELPMDGARVIGLFRNARNPGLIDPTISLIQALGEDGKPITTIVNFACHTESLNAGVTKIAADFPGAMCEQMKKDSLGQPVFLNGAVGGMVSGDNDARTFESSDKMGLQLAAIVKELVATAQPPAKFEFAAESREIQIPLTNAALKLLHSKSESKSKLLFGRATSEMQYLRLGEAQIVTLPGELLPEVSFEILEKMEGFPRILVGLANDEIGYIIPPYDFQDKSYEESMSQGPATAAIVRDAALRMIQGIR